MDLILCQNLSCVMLTEEGREGGGRKWKFKIDFVWPLYFRRYCRICSCLEQCFASFHIYFSHYFDSISSRPSHGKYCKHRNFRFWPICSVLFLFQMVFTAGILVNEGFNWVLKHTIKQPRPTRGLLHRFRCLWTLSTAYFCIFGLQLVYELV